MMSPFCAAQPTMTQAVRQQATVPFHAAIVRPQQIAVSSSNNAVRESYKPVWKISKKI